MEFRVAVSGRLWIVRLAEELAARVDRLIRQWPKAGNVLIADQLSRASLSIGANIAEGYARLHTKERSQFFGIAQGSLGETLYWLRVARRRGLITELDSSVLCGMYIKLGKGIVNFAEHDR